MYENLSFEISNRGRGLGIKGETVAILWATT